MAELSSDALPGYGSMPDCFTHRLSRLINLLLLLAPLVTAGSLVFIVNQAYQATKALQQSLAELPVYVQALSTQEAISAERGPTNAMLGGMDASPVRLAQARALSDERFAHFKALLDRCSTCRITPERADAALQALHIARGRVDLLLQSKTKPPGDLADAAVQGMLQASERHFELVEVLLQGIVMRTPGITLCLVNSKLAARLRDTAGRLGSLLTRALIEARPLTPAETVAQQRTLGRIEQLTDLLTINLNLAFTAPEQAAVERIRQDYLGEGLQIYAQTVADLANGHAVSAALFAQRYVPSMASIVVLRDVALHLAIDEAQRLTKEAERRLLLTLGAALGVLLVLGGGLLLLRWRVLTPLLASTQRLLALTGGDQPPNAVASGNRHRVLDALEQLERQLHQAEGLRRERDDLIAELEIRAGTDHLTGLPNRRAFEQRLVAEDENAHGLFAAITFDIDHFKRINDTFGHAAGDLLLQQLSQRCLRLIHDGDQIARIGGEEFAVLAQVRQEKEALALAERLRRVIAEAPFDLGTGSSLAVTASFGIAVASTTTAQDRARLLAMADAALYRAKRCGRNRSEVAESA